MPTRAELLQAHIEAVEGQPVVWGQSDCTSWAANWVAAATGRAVPMLGTYTSLDEAHALIDEAGGLDVLWTRALAQVAIYASPYEPVLGDVALIDTASFGLIGSVVAEGGIALVRANSVDGLTGGVRCFRPRRFFKVWHI